MFFEDDGKRGVVFREMFEVYCNIFESVTKDIMYTNLTKRQKDRATLAREIQLRLIYNSPILSKMCLSQVDPILIGRINFSDESFTCCEAGFLPNLSKILIYYHPDIKVRIPSNSQTYIKSIISNA